MRKMVFVEQIREMQFSWIFFLLTTKDCKKILMKSGNTIIYSGKLGQGSKRLHKSPFVTETAGGRILPCPIFQKHSFVHAH